VCQVAAAIEGAFTCHGDVLLLEGVDERRVSHELDAFPPREDSGKVSRRILVKGDRRA
jgi:hypothetical protein